MEKLDFDEMKKVSGGVLSITEKNGKFKVIKEYEPEFSSQEEAQSWLNGKAEKHLDRGCRRHGHKPFMRCGPGENCKP